MAKTIDDQKPFAVPEYIHCNFVPPYTFSRTFLPNNPAGRKIKIKINTTNATPSRHRENPAALTSDSMTPNNKPPTIAPGIIPIPPNNSGNEGFKSRDNSH